jgi:hypothetical protein
MSQEPVDVPICPAGAPNVDTTSSRLSPGFALLKSTGTGLLSSIPAEQADKARIASTAKCFIPTIVCLFNLKLSDFKLFIGRGGEWQGGNTKSPETRSPRGARENREFRQRRLPAPEFRAVYIQRCLDSSFHKAAFEGLSFKHPVFLSSRSENAPQGTAECSPH